MSNYTQQTVQQSTTRSNVPVATTQSTQLGQMSQEQMLQHHNLYHRKNVLAGQENVYHSNEPRVLTSTQETHMYQRNEPIIERTYDKAPTIIRHDEKSVFESHTVPTQVERNVLQARIETHVEQPIIKEHHKDIIHEHHQNVVHEHHKNIIHEQHQDIIHEHHLPIIHKEEIREIHQPVIHETHKEVIHDISKPFIHESHSQVVEEQFKGPIIHEEFQKPVVHEIYEKPIYDRKVEQTVFQQEVGSTQHYSGQSFQTQFTSAHSSHKCKNHKLTGCRDCQTCIECDKVRLHQRQVR
ncbi:UNKNOWN [Stylonychia lemnae]|uniref:Uncharacterized protein n=1 Tax=Stylonychia lemnae TaxID=5949 RepID=A0A078AA05_STYLE|nr:UNKNOWN [Stylonychia lemnae]|eukprot:CDW79100.1 UNKNOWN [Stylonychia lemnae]